MEKLTFILPEFEGPLDLLLHLISKHKLDIYNIEISKLLEQYIVYIEQLKKADLEVASEFLEMAARLVYIKSVSLLPKYEDAEVLKQELTGQLLEYQECKEVAAKLAKINKYGLAFVREPQKVEFDQTYLLTHDKSVLLDAYLSVRGKQSRRVPPPMSSFTGIVSKRIVSVTSRIISVLKTLISRKTSKFNDLFVGCRDRGEMVATFLAILELVKSNRVTLDDKNTLVKLSGKTSKE